MAYPERKPIYDTYKQLVDEIVRSKLYREYAETEIEELNKSLLQTFKQIALIALMQKWTDESTKSTS